LEYRQTVSQVNKELFGCFGRVLLGSILDQEEMLRRACQYAQQKNLITIRIEFALNPLMEQATGKELDQPKCLVRFALARRLDSWRLTPARPGITQTTPLGKARFIAEENPGLPLSRRTQNLRPFQREPRLTVRFVEMIRNELGFLERVVQVPQQFTHVVTSIEDLELASNQLLDQECIPASRLETGGLRSGINQFAQTGLLSLG
jgi:hypothetical protein